MDPWAAPQIVYQPVLVLIILGKWERATIDLIFHESSVRVTIPVAVLGILLRFWHRMSHIAPTGFRRFYKKLTY